MKLSILDMAPVDYGASAKQALCNVIDLAQKADRWGYERFWVTEHHNMATVASATPEMLIGQIAAHTSRIRVGSGGVMIPNHSPYKVAENFKLLEAFYPGRVDLGIGRAPGTDGRTALALRRSQQPYKAGDLPALLHELKGYDHPRQDDENPFSELIAMPQDVKLPPVWLLGSSSYSAGLAANEGLRYVFAHHFNPGGAVEAIELYRHRFLQQQGRAAESVLLVVSVIAGENAQELKMQERIMALKYLLFSGYVPASVLDNVDKAVIPAHLYTAANAYLSTMVRATFSELESKLTQLADYHNVDELMITSNIQGYESRVRLYEQLAGLFLSI